MLIAAALLALSFQGCQSLERINPFRGCCGGGGGLFRRDRVIPYSSEPGLAPGAVEVLPPQGGIEIEPGPGTYGGFPEPNGFNPSFSGDGINSPRGSSTLEIDPESNSSSVNPTSSNTRDESDSASALNQGRGADTSQSARPATLGASSAPTGDDDPLDGLPDIQLPPMGSLSIDPVPADPGLGRPSETPPVAPGPDASAPEPEPDPPPESSTDTEGFPTTSIPGVAPQAGPPGIVRIFSVEPGLSAGPFPNETTWEQLREYGYRTILDLRPIDRVSPADLAASSSRGLRHVMAPMTPGVIDEGLVDRFEQELAQRDARPLFFCDADGSAAAALWYVHRVEAEGIDRDIARRDAEQIAPIDPALLAAADAYLLAALPFAEAPGEADATVAATWDELPAEPFARSSADEASTSTAAESAPARAAPPADPEGWRPYAALMLCVLVVPLAYWGGIGLPVGFRNRVLASLPGPARRPRSLPGASDAGR